ncbi:MAG: acyltransferase [Bacteroidetes bacterium]|nr:acyltransferase [Bacteroidota bacterium]
MEQVHGKRIYGLDIFRAVAILLVLLLHSRLALTGTAADRLPWGRIPDGVELFFVLSGFLIGGILLRIITAEGMTMPVMIAFWRRRWYRTLPAYYLILVINYVVVRYNVIHEGIYNFNWRYFFFLQNFSRPFVGFYRESWSLSIEEWFYVIVPILLFMVVRFARLKMAYLIVVAIMLVVPVIFRLVLMNSSYDGFWVDLSIRKVVVTRLDSIGYGLLVAWFYYYHRDICVRYQWGAFVIGIAGSVLLSAYRQPPGTIYSQILYFSLSPLLMALLLPAAADIRYGTGQVARFVSYTSRISYSLYLVNFSLVAEVIRDQFPPHGEMDALLKYIAYWLIVYTAGSILYHGFEKPMMDLRDK